MHWIVSGSTGVTSEALTAGELRLHGVDPRDLQMFLAEVGKNDQARGEVMAAEYVYARDLYDLYLGGSDGLDATQVMNAHAKVTSPASMMFGALDFGAVSELRADYAEADRVHNDALRSRFFWVGLGANAAADVVPRGGATSAYLSTTVLDQIEQQMQRDSTGAANYYTGDIRHATATALSDMINEVAYAQLTSQLTPEELLARVPVDLYDEVEALVNGAGEFVPMEEWGQEHWQAWDIYKSSAGSDLETYLQTTAQEAYYGSFQRTQDDLESSIYAGLPR